MNDDDLIARVMDSFYEPGALVKDEAVAAYHRSIREVLAEARVRVLREVDESIGGDVSWLGWYERIFQPLLTAAESDLEALKAGGPERET